jgi:hypothetical protein
MSVDLVMTSDEMWERLKSSDHIGQRCRGVQPNAARSSRWFIMKGICHFKGAST